MTAKQEHSEEEVTNPSCGSGADLQQDSEQMCAPIHADTRAHTPHSHGP